MIVYELLGKKFNENLEVNDDDQIKSKNGKRSLRKVEDEGKSPYRSYEDSNKRSEF
jgi:hypothetical protein